jgi:hypothetical protein
VDRASRNSGGDKFGLPHRRPSVGPRRPRRRHRLGDTRGLGLKRYRASAIHAPEIKNCGERIRQLRAVQEPAPRLSGSLQTLAPKERPGTMAPESKRSGIGPAVNNPSVYPTLASSTCQRSLDTATGCGIGQYSRLGQCRPKFVFQNLPANRCGEIVKDLNAFGSFISG